MCYDLLRFSSWFGDLCEMEAWTTSVASDSILPFHLPPFHTPTRVVFGSSTDALAIPQHNSVASGVAAPLRADAVGCDGRLLLSPSIQAKTS